jgi:hypothetical protein
MINKEFIMSEIARLENLAEVYSQRDWDRYEQLKSEIRKLEMQVLDIMVSE